MNRIEYVGDGETQKFVFNASCFNLGDIHVCINGNELTSGFNIEYIKNENNAGMPYTVSAVELDTAPISTDVITIYREIQLVRVVDYQPTTPIDTDALNQDFNFAIEVLKDFSDKVHAFEATYKNAASGVLLTRINATMDAIDALGNISNKANVDADNFSATGRATLSGLGFCSNKYTNISNNGNGATFVAPANGYVACRKSTTAAGQYLEIKDSAIGFDQISYAVIEGQSVMCNCPCRKGDTIEIWCTATGETKYCRFYYATGEQ